MDEDSTESKVDDLLHYVMQLVERQKEEVSSVCVSVCLSVQAKNISGDLCLQF